MPPNDPRKDLKKEPWRLANTMAALSLHEAVSLRLLLVRHGLSSFNVERRIQGRDDLSTLTTTGRNRPVAQAGAG